MDQAAFLAKRKHQQHEAHLAIFAARPVIEGLVERPRPPLTSLLESGTRGKADPLCSSRAFLNLPHTGSVRPSTCRDPHKLAISIRKTRLLPGHLAHERRG
jgi:hypothetical protein